MIIFDRLFDINIAGNSQAIIEYEQRQVLLLCLVVRLFHDKLLYQMIDKLFVAFQDIRGTRRTA